MRKILFLFCFFSVFSLQAQNYEYFSLVEKDSILIKWLPKDFESLRDIRKGALIQRVEVSSDIVKIENVSFSNATETRVDVFDKNYSSLDEDSKFFVLMEPIKLGATELEEKNFALGTNFIENSINPDYQYVLGNIFVDRDIKKNTVYCYQITVGDSKKHRIIVNTSKPTVYSKQVDLKLSLDKKKTVTVEWNNNELTKEVVGYTIDHSVSNNKNPESVLDQPYIGFKSNFEKKDKWASYRLDSLKKGKFHFFKVNGLDPFGLPNYNSEWKKIYVPDILVASAHIDTVWAEGKIRSVKTVVLDSYKEKNIEKIGLFRSANKDDGYELIEERTFRDSVESFQIEGKLSDDHFYYVTKIYNEDDTVSSLPYYFFTLDQEPPKAPIDLAGKIDSSGVVRINWNIPEEDKLRGFRVFKGNAKDEDFVEQTQILKNDLFFLDTLPLNNLTSQVYYFVRSVDMNFNNSQTSDTLLLLKPDTIPPVPCVLKSTSREGHAIKILWNNSVNEDFKVSRLIRTDKSGRKKLIFSWSDTSSNYIDTGLVAGFGYQYQIETLDISDNKSYSKELFQFFEPGTRKPINEFQGKIDLAQKAIILTWEKPKNQKVYSYSIYRTSSIGDFSEKLLPLKDLFNGELSYTDKNVRINKKYRYSIKYITEDGIHSLPVNIDLIYQ